jgi:hypothetical protein
MGAFADVAPQLHRSGFNVVPAKGKSAIAPWKHLQTQRQTEVELSHLIQRYRNADPAIVLGSASGVVDLDADDPAVAEEAIRKAGLPLPPTSCFDSRRGPHRLYRSAEDLPKRPSLLPGLDFLGRGAIVIVPPAAGRRWLVGLKYLADLPPSWVNLVRSFPSLPPHLIPIQVVSLEYTRDLPLLQEREGQFFENWQAVRRVCAVLRIGAVRLKQGFRCVLPDHDEQRPSASLFRNRSDRIVYHDWHRRSGTEWFTLPEVYAAQVSGRVRKIDGPELAMWARRLLHAAGVIELPEIPAPPLAHDATPAMRRVTNGFVLLLRCHRLYDGDAPAPFTWAFASRWCRIGENQAGEAIMWLIRNRFLVSVGSHRGLTLFTLGAGGKDT